MELGATHLVCGLTVVVTVVFEVGNGRVTHTPKRQWGARVYLNNHRAPAQDPHLRDVKGTVEQSWRGKAPGDCGVLFFTASLWVYSLTSGERVVRAAFGAAPWHNLCGCDMQHH